MVAQRAQRREGSNKKTFTEPVVLGRTRVRENPGTAWPKNIVALHPRLFFSALHLRLFGGRPVLDRITGRLSYSPLW